MTAGSTISLTAVVITFNEERNIARCLSSLQAVADEIIVLDSFSTDQTPGIAASFPKVRLYSAAWLGYSASKNYANSLASNDWILSLDADEELSETLINSLLTWKHGLNPTPAGFNRLTNYCGQWIRHCGWYPDFKFRVFNRQQFQWKGEIHEVLFPLSGVFFKPDFLQGNCLHYSYYSPEEHLKQTEKFSRLWALQAYQQGKKYSVTKRYLGPFIRFLRDFLLKGGILDGKSGFKICLVSASGIAMRQKFLFDYIRKS